MTIFNFLMLIQVLGSALVLGVGLTQINKERRVPSSEEYAVIIAMGFLFLVGLYGVGV